jgi:hypothetical protein
MTALSDFVCIFCRSSFSRRSSFRVLTTTVLSEGQRSNLILCFIGEMRERDKVTNGIIKGKKGSG